ncbi:hypothetical protein [Fodinicola feengrottensis]
MAVGPAGMVAAGTTTGIAVVCDETPADAGSGRTTGCAVVGSVGRVTGGSTEGPAGRMTAGGAGGLPGRTTGGISDGTVADAGGRPAGGPG